MTERAAAEAGAPYVFSLDDPAAADRGLVGGKGANLAGLVAAGMAVPEGFCVTTAAYRALVDDESIRARIRALAEVDPADTRAVAEAGADLRDRIRERDVPAAVREAIERRLAEAPGGPDAGYAVRSSATAEDLPAASFAGQQETYLGVRGAEDVVDRVRDCAASLFTDRAIAYRARNDVDHGAVELAVVVQRLVDPNVSGVLFTAEPTTGNRTVLAIEAVSGLGEALVSGDVDADAVRVDTRTGEVDYEVGDQRRAVRPRPGGGTETVDLDRSERGSRLLTDEDVRALVDLGEEVEGIFGTPQDVEWCLADGDLYVLQSRPITSLFPLPSPSPADDGLHVYYSVGHAQAFPEAMPPLVRDVWLAWSRSAMAAYGLDPAVDWAVEAGGRLYLDITPVLRVGPLRDAVPGLLSAVSEPMAVALEDLLRRRGDDFEADRDLLGTLAALPALARATWNGVRTGLPLLSAMFDGFLGAFVGEPTQPEREEARWIAWGRRNAARVRAGETPAERAHTVFDLDFTETLAESLPRVGPLMAAFAVDGWLRRRFPDDPEEVDAVGRGFPKELVTRINLGLGDLADVAREHPPVADTLRDGASLEALESVEGGEAFLAAFDDYLAEFGHRATGELDVSRPRWREDPSGLLAAVRANLEHGEPGEHHERVSRMEREAEAAARRLEARVDRGPLGPVRRRILRQLLTTYRGYIQTREYPKQGTAHMFAAWREALLDAGEALAAEGVLERADDVWFLRKEELFAALDREPISVDVDARRDEFERQTALDPPPILTSEGEVPTARIQRADVPEGALVGTGVSGGVVEGVARVVRDPTEETIERGEILVAPSSDPGWTPLFLNAAGMVVEVGGRMSHGALVAREYGLPAVVSVPDATRRIRTGQRIRIDGTRGLVEVVDDGDPG